jgi:hypothetical protein
MAANVVVGTDFEQLRRFCATAVDGIATARMKITSWRGMGRVGNVAFQDDAL